MHNLITTPGVYVTKCGRNVVVESIFTSGREMAFGFLVKETDGEDAPLMWYAKNGAYVFEGNEWDIVKPYVEPKKAEEKKVEEAASFNLILPHVFIDRLGDALDSKTKLGVISTGASLARMANSVGIEEVEEIGMGEYKITITKV